MELSSRDKRGLARLRKICAFANVDLTGLSEVHAPLRPVFLQIATHNIVLGHVVSRYTVMDDLLNRLIISYFFGAAASRDSPLKKVRVFQQRILDEMYLLKKMQTVHEIKPIPKKAGEFLKKLNAIRNAMTHSQRPELRKEYRKAKKVTYAGRDIYTPDGLGDFEADYLSAHKTLMRRIPGERAWKLREVRKAFGAIGLKVITEEQLKRIDATSPDAPGS